MTTKTPAESSQLRTLSGGDLEGVVFVVLAASLWGTTGIGAKISYGFGVGPEGILTLRLTLTIPAYVALLVRRSVRRISISVAAIGLLVLGPYHILYYYAIMYAGVSTASLILYTHPVLVAVLSKYVLKEPAIKRTYIALPFSVLGAALVSLDEVSFNAIGIVLATLSSVLFSLYVVLSKLAMERGVKPDEIALGSSPWALPTILLFQVVRGFNWVSAVRLEVIIVAVYLALVVSIIAYLLYMKGMKVVGAARATILSTAEPLTATAMSVLLFGEPMNIVKAVGGLLIVTAVIVVASKRGSALI
ncbi:MAG: EamA family transporter [Sulfolobales archaeon]